MAVSPAPPVREHHQQRMSGEAWVLFAAMSLIWGLPYLFIKVAVAEVDPATLVFARTTLALIILLPLAMRAGALRPALRHWRPAAIFALLEMGIPWLLLSDAETRISSALAGLLLAAVPIIGAVVTAFMGDRHNLAPMRLAGMLLGVVGVAALVGVDASAGHLDWLSVAQLLTVATCYAVAPIIIDRQANPAPAIGTITVSILLVSVAYLPFGVPGLVRAWPLQPDTAGSLLVLGWLCTALAFVLFFRLIAAAGPVRAVVITFINPAVAIVLGVVVLSENITAGMLVGFPLVILGSFLATRPSARVSEMPG
ncbi:MAG: DMT family transporter [Candidatus Nanopelagicales bacterium]|mgnify:FL=1